MLNRQKYPAPDRIFCAASGAAGRGQRSKAPRFWWRGRAKRRGPTAARISTANSIASAVYLSISADMRCASTGATNEAPAGYSYSRSFTKCGFYMELSKPRARLTSDLQSQALRVGDISPHQDTSAVIYDCDPQANRRAIARVNELSRLRLLKGTREEAIEAAWQELDNAIKPAPKKATPIKVTVAMERARDLRPGTGRADLPGVRGSYRHWSAPSGVLPPTQARRSPSCGPVREKAE